MPLSFPERAWLVRFRDQAPPSWSIHEAVGTGGCLFAEGGEAVVKATVDFEACRALPGVVAVEPAWFASDRGLSSRFDKTMPEVRALHGGWAVVASTDRESVLRALAEIEVPLRLLWKLHGEGPEDVPALARAALDGDTAVLPILADALEERGHPAASAARRLAEEVLGLPPSCEGDPLVIRLGAAPCALRFAGDGESLVVVDARMTVRVFDAAGGGERPGESFRLPPFTLDGYDGDPVAITDSLAVSGDGRLIAVLYTDVPELWSVARRQRIGLLSSAESPLALHAHFSLDGRYFVAPVPAGASSWEVETGRCLGPLPDNGFVTPLGFLADGRLALSGEGATWAFTPLPTPATLDWRPSPAESIYAVVRAVSPDGRRIARDAAGVDSHVYDPKSGRDIALKHGRCPLPILFTPDGQGVIGLAVGEVLLFDAETGELRRSFPGYDSSIGEVALSPNAARLAVLGPGNMVRVWRTDVARDTSRIADSGHDPIQSVAVSPDGKRCCITGYRPAECGLEHFLASDFLLPREGARATAVAYAPDGKRLAMGFDGGEVSVFPEGDLPFGSAEPAFAVTALAWSPDGRSLTVGYADGSTRGNPGLPPTGSAIRGIAYSPDGWTLVSVSDDGTVRFGNGEPISLGQTCLGVAWSSLLAVVTDRGVVLLDDQGRIVGERTDLFGASSVCFVSPHTLAVGDWDGVTLIDTLTGRTVRRLEGSGGEVLSLSFGSGVLLGGCRDGKARWWRV